MHRSFKYLLPFFLFLCYSFTNQERNVRQLLIDALNELDKESSLIKIIPVIKKDEVLFHKLPIGKPLKEKYRVSSPFGSRYHPIDKKMKFHSGIDLVAEYASTIHATADGTVTFAGIKGGYGKCVVINHGYNFQTVYAHMTLYYTKKNKKVKKGDVIGFLGSTGKSTGNHLHYEIKWKDNKPINPANWID